MKNLLTVAVLLIAIKAYGFDQSHSAFTKMLNLYVVESGAESTVNYTAFKNDELRLDSYLLEISNVSSQSFNKFSPNEKLAFLINAYNAFTIKLILMNYPVTSIKKIGGIFSSPWKQRVFKLFGKEVHLDEIEHEMIRKGYSDPRVHFSLVCASVGCPSLASKAYTATNLSEVLEERTALFLSDKKRNRYDPQSKTLHLSPIFKWYGGDFEKESGSVVNFVKERMSFKDKIITETIFTDYDWSLNGK